MWEVWQDQARASKEGEGTAPPGLRRGGRRPANAPPRDKHKPPAYYDDVVERTEMRLEAEASARRTRHIKAYVYPGLFMLAFVVGVGALLLPYFPFLGRIPVLGDLMMLVFNRFLSPYR